MDIRLLLIGIGVCLVSANPETPQGCAWRKEGEAHNESLVCRLESIFDAPAVLGNLSTSRPDSVISLGLECNEVPLFASRLDSPSADDFYSASLPRLERLRIDDCKMRYLAAGAFASFSNLKSLLVRSHNADWSSVAMELNRYALRGLHFLRHLNLAYNNIWSLPADLLCPVATTLLTLNVSHNQLQDTAALGLTNSYKPCASSLEELDLSHNDISALNDDSFSGLKSLTILKLENNAIGAVGDHAFAGLESLRSLNMSSNKLVALPPDLFNRTRELREIILSNNSLSILAPGLLDGLEQLQNLDLSNNKLTSQWPTNRDMFARLSRLVSLDLSYNALKKIDANVFRGLIELQVLRLEHNEISFMADECFETLRNLRSLTLSHNKLVNFDAKHAVGLNSLTQLFIEDNRLQTVHPEAFANLSALQDLSLSGNQLKEIPVAVKRLRSLKTLDLGNNHVSIIDDDSFAGLDQVYGLRMVDNKVENISRYAFTALPALQVLNLASNRLRHIEQNAFAKNAWLQAIRLDGNQLTEIRGVFANLSSLVWLNVSDNKLLWFDYSHLPPSLGWLDMHSNQISELGNFYSLGDNRIQIEILDVSHNRITELSEVSLPSSIKTVFLNNNKIRNVAPNTFLQKNKLEKVVLSGNELQHLEITALSLQPVASNRELPAFYIGDNPILCDCTMEWLPRINDLARARQHPRVMDLDAVTCEMVHVRATPRRPLLSLRTKDFLCRYETHCFALCHCCDFDACDCEMTCPDNCSCYHDHSWSSNVVDCSNAGYKTVPDQIPMDATEIYLDGNQLDNLGSHVFIGKKRLEVLYLNNSAIASIHNRTFNGVDSLKVLHLEGNSLRELKGFEFDQVEKVSELYLDHNAIAKVGNTTFRKLKSLEVLRLDNNRIVDFQPWRDLAGVVSTATSISLEGNTWSCDCNNAARLRTWLAEHRGDTTDKMYCRDGIETLTQAIRRCGDPSSEAAISRGIREGGPLVGGSFVPLLAGALVVIIALCLFIALAFAFRQDVRLWAHSKYGLRLGKVTAPPDEERDRLYDGYFIYSEQDEDFVTRCIAAELEQNGLALCLHWRDLPPSRLQETLPQAASASRRIVIAFSPIFFANEWQYPELRQALRTAIEGIRPASRRRRIIVLLAPGATPRDPELQLLLQTCTVIVWGEKRFWEKLRYAMPDCADKRKDSKAPATTDRGRNAARYTTTPSVVETWNKPTGVLVPIHIPTPTPTQSTYVSSASSRTEDEDSGAEHQHHGGGYSALHANASQQRPASLSSRGSHLYSTIPELPSHAPPSFAPMPVNSRTYFV